MPKYALLTDVMVQGTPRSTGEVLDLSLSDGNLLVGLGRAKSVDATSSDEALEPKAEAEALEPKAEDAESTAKPLVRRRTTSTSTSV